MRKNIIKPWINAGLLVFAAINISFAANRYWVGGDGDWSDNTAHWSFSSGGIPGGGIPGSSDIVFFDSGSGAGTCNIDTAVNVSGFNLSSSTITVLQGANTITIGASNAYLNAGTFLGGNADMNINALTICGANFTSTSTNLTITGAGYCLWVSSGSFIHNNGTVNIAGASFTIQPGSGTYNNVNFLATTTSASVGQVGTWYVSGNVYSARGRGTDIVGPLEFVGTGPSIVSSTTVSNACGLGYIVVSKTGTGTVSVANMMTISNLVINPSGGTGGFDASGTPILLGSFINKGNFIAGTSTVSIDCSNLTITPGNSTYNNVVFAHEGNQSTYINGTMLVGGNLYTYNTNWNYIGTNGYIQMTGGGAHTAMSISTNVALGTSGVANLIVDTNGGTVSLGSNFYWPHCL